MVDLALFLRDHRENTSGPVYVETLDFLADVIEAAGQSRATVLSAYRTEKTNRMLASRIFGVAEKSQHLVGRAIDITLDRNLSPAAKHARKLGRGGVGWYPDNHFIHLDSGPIRNWTIDNTLVAGRGTKGGRVYDIFQPARIAKTGEAIKRPLSVRERLQLQRAVAKHQATGH
jgi:ribosomal protein S18